MNGYEAALAHVGPAALSISAVRDADERSRFVADLRQPYGADAKSDMMG